MSFWPIRLIYVTLIGPPKGLRIHQTKEIAMKATITKLCMGDRNCNKICPEVFEYDEDQLLSIVKFETIPAHLEDIVRRAARECGAEAITIEE
jgi:ferredoxin